MKKLSFAIGFLLVLACLLPSFSQAGNSNPHPAYRKGKRFYRKSDYIKAIPYLKYAYNLDPDNVKVVYRLARATYGSGDIAGSMHYFVEAYNLDQSFDEEINYYMARSMHMNGQFEEALTYYQADLQRLDPNSADHLDTRNRIAQCKAAPATAKLKSPHKVDNLGECVNTPYPEYASTFSDDFQYMIFTTRRPRTLRQMTRRRHHVEDINEEVYEATQENGVWRRAKVFRRPIRRWSHDASIKLAEGGNTLIYYVDNRNRGDVYVSKMEDGHWSKRRSIGANINTKDYNEPSVCIAEGGQVLYWVSDKPGGQGQKDIYMSRMGANGEWEPGTNLGASINSPYDEDAPMVSPDGKYLYFASRGHNSMGGYDLFVCERKGNGWDSPRNMGTPINTVGDEIYLVPDGAKGFYFSSDRPGGYGEKDLYYASPVEAAPGEVIVFSGTVLENGTQQPLAGDMKLVNAETNALVKEQALEPKGGFNFTVPSDGGPYRLDFTMDERAGGSKPGKLNVVSGRVIDAVNQMPLDANVELVDEKGNVIEKMNTNPATGNYMFPIESGRPYRIHVSAKSYQAYSEAFEVSPTTDLLAHYSDIPLQRETEAKKIVITWQFFDVDKSEIKANYIQDLENVVGIMKKAPEIKLNIIGHTDADASDDHNQVLSENRAKAVAKYLTDRGIDGKRLNITGMGESMPIYPNTSPELKKWNRRVELYIIE